MAMISMMPEDVAILIWKNVFDESVKEITKKKIDKQRNKNIFNNLYEGKLMDWLLYMETEWLQKKVEQYFEENDPEDMITTDYKEVSNLVFLDEMDDMMDEIKFSNTEIKMMINEIGIDRLSFLTDYINDESFEAQYVIDKNKPEYGIEEDEYKEVMATIFICYRWARYDY